MTNESAALPTRHGILVVHGAGLSEDEEHIEGDPLSTIANGMIDAFSNGPFCQQYRLATKAKTKEHGLTELNLDVFRKSKDGRTETLAHTIRMCEVLWRPTMRKMNLSEYIPLLWQWAFAFESHTVRKAEVEGRMRRTRARQDSAGKPVSAEDESQVARRRRDFLGRFLLAVLGVAATSMWMLIAGEIVKQFYPSWVGDPENFKHLWQITTSVISISVVSALLLILLAVEEWFNRTGQGRGRKGVSRPSGRLHLLAMILTTAWLAPFVLPLLIVAYYFDRVFSVGIEVALAAGAIYVILWVDDWWQRLAFLLGVAFVLWLVSQVPSTTIGRFSIGLRGNLQSTLVQILTALLVAGSAPVVIALIRVLNLLALLPIGGGTFQKLAQSLSEAGLWNTLKESNMFLTDSSRSAVVRDCIEEKLKQVAQDMDSVHILAHSLGSVVAYETMVQIGRDDGVVIKKGDPLYRKIRTLVTYGSPLNKIRILANKTAESRQVMCGLDYTRFCDGANLPTDLSNFRWLNFYSFQDIVSDALTLYSRPEDPVPPIEYSVESANDIATAHGAYWTDPGFWNTTLQALGLVLESSDLAQIEELSRTDTDVVKALREQGIYTKGQLQLVAGDPCARSRIVNDAKGRIAEDQLKKTAEQLA